MFKSKGKFWLKWCPKSIHMLYEKSCMDIPKLLHSYFWPQLLWPLCVLCFGNKADTKKTQSFEYKRIRSPLLNLNLMQVYVYLTLGNVNVVHLLTNVQEVVVILQPVWIEKTWFVRADLKPYWFRGSIKHVSILQSEVLGSQHRDNKYFLSMSTYETLFSYINYLFIVGLTNKCLMESNERKE